MIFHSGGGRGEGRGWPIHKTGNKYPSWGKLLAVFFFSFFFFCCAGKKRKEESGNTSASESGSEILYCLQVKQEITCSTGDTYRTVHVMCLTSSISRVQSLQRQTNGNNETRTRNTPNCDQPNSRDC